MISFKSTIEKFGENGEKSGWTYVFIPSEIAAQLKPGFKKSFRVKGKLDKVPVSQLALIPAREGDFILPLNAELRKLLGKRKGAEIQLSLAEDKSEFLMNKDLMLCLEEDSEALTNFKKLSGSEQRYFSKWVDGAKTEPTRAKRIAQTLEAMHKGYHYGQLIRSLKKTTSE